MQASIFPMALTRKMTAYRVSFKAFVKTLTLLSCDSCVEFSVEVEESSAVVKFENMLLKVEFELMAVLIRDNFIITLEYMNIALGSVSIGNQGLSRLEISTEMNTKSRYKLRL